LSVCGVDLGNGYRVGFEGGSKIGVLMGFGGDEEFIENGVG